MRRPGHRILELLVRDLHILGLLTSDGFELPDNTLGRVPIRGANDVLPDVGSRVCEDPGYELARVVLCVVHGQRHGGREGPGQSVGVIGAFPDAAFEVRHEEAREEGNGGDVDAFSIFFYLGFAVEVFDVFEMIFSY